MFYCCGTLLVFLSVRDRVYNTQNADNSSQSNTYKTFLPLAFVRSGRIYLDYGWVGGMGTEGFSRMRSIYTEDGVGAYSLRFNTTAVNPNGRNGQCIGLPLRCLYPGSA